MDRLVKVWNKIWCYILAGLFAVPHLVLASYSVPGVDDYSCANAVDIYRANHSFLVSAILYARDTYFTWQGTYTGEILMGLEPSVRNSYTALRLILILSVVLFVAGVVLLTFTIAHKFFGLSRNSSWAIALLSEFLAFNISPTGELFSWYTGASVYTFPIIAYLFALSFSILSYYEGKKVFVVLAAICGFIGSGGSLMVVGFGCSSFFVLVLIYTYILKPKKSNFNRYIRLVIPFVVTVIGALICVAAPGNYVRQGGSMHIPESFFYSGVNVLTHVCFMIRHYLLPLCFVIAFIIGLVANRRVISKEKVFFGILGFCFITTVTAFPVILGYDSYCFEAYTNSDRVLYVIDFIICILVLLLALLLGGYISGVMKHFEYDVKKEMVKFIPTLIIIFMLISNGLVQNFLNGMSMKILDDLMNRRVQIVSMVMEDIYREIASSNEGEDVHVYRPVNPYTVMYAPQYVLDNEYFGNAEVAKYYHVNSFTMEWLEY